MGMNLKILIVLFIFLGIIPPASRAYSKEELDYKKSNKYVAGETIKAFDKITNSLKGQPISGALMFYDPIDDTAGAVHGLSYLAGDRAWVEACLKVYDLYRQLGGERSTERFVFRRDGKRYFIAASKHRGVWFDNIDQALIYFLKQLLARSRALPRSVLDSLNLDTSKKSIQSVGQFIFMSMNLPKAPIKLAAHDTIQIELENAEIAVGDSSLVIRQQLPTSKGVRAKITTSNIAKPGLHKIYGFSSKNKFRAESARDITITDLTTTSSHRVKNQPPEKQYLKVLKNGLTDSISRTGQINRYKLKVDAPTTILLSSEGPSDTTAQILNSNGELISKDDDGGQGYNFRLLKRLDPGAYTLLVSHCCAGIGPYKLKISQH